MKIVIPVMGETLNSPVNNRFGHAEKLILFDIETGLHQVVDNTRNAKAEKGSGIRTAENISRLGAKCLISRHCGSMAFSMLQAAGIEVFLCSNDYTVAEVIEMFRKGKLRPAKETDVDGYWE